MIGEPASFGGVGLHSGASVRVALEPAPPGTGLVFVRTDLPGAPEVRAALPALRSTDRATTIAHGDARVQTVEHVLAALHGTGRWDARVLVHGPELPIADGSAAPFLPLVLALPEGRRRPLRPVRRIEVEAGGGWARIEPASATSVEVEIEFDPPVGRQAARWDGTRQGFVEGIAPARTFTFEPDLRALQARGLAAGANVGCGVLFGSDGPTVGAPLRFPDEPARHKLLDLLGDLALLGAPLWARVRFSRGGHALATRLLRRLVEAGAMEEVAASRTDRTSRGTSDGERG